MSGKDPIFTFESNELDENAFVRMSILEICLNAGHFMVTPAHVLAAALDLHLSGRRGEGGLPPHLDEERWRLSRLLLMQPIVTKADSIELVGANAYMRADAAALWHHLAGIDFELTAIAGFLSELSVEATSPSLISAGYPPTGAMNPDLPAVSSDPGAEERTQARAALRSLIGMEETKELVARISAVESANAHRKERGLKPVGGSMHYVFAGSPGTGKTTVARLMGAILADVGALSRGHLVEVSRADLIGRFLGETAMKTRSALESARGGVFFVDEAYSLIADANDDMYGREAIVEILRFMESNRNDMAIVLAGYEEEVRNLLELNPGLKSRFSTFVPFPDYSSVELLSIFMLMCDEHDISANKSVLSAVKSYIERSSSAAQQGNARFVRNLFEEMYRLMASRAVADGVISERELTRFVVDDVPVPAGETESIRIGFQPNEV